MLLSALSSAFNAAQAHGSVNNVTRSSFAASAAFLLLLLEAGPAALVTWFCVLLVLEDQEDPWTMLSASEGLRPQRPRASAGETGGY